MDAGICVSGMSIIEMYFSAEIYVPDSQNDFDEFYMG